MQQTILGIEDHKLVFHNKKLVTNIFLFKLNSIFQIDFLNKLLIQCSKFHDLNILFREFFFFRTFLIKSQKSEIEKVMG
jgi:hypothetical protein